MSSTFSCPTLFTKVQKLIKLIISNYYLLKMMVHHPHVITPLLNMFSMRSISMNHLNALIV